jgi:CHRD domain-containing protein
VRTRLIMLLLIVVATTAGALAATASGSDGGRPLDTALTGAAEAPGPGDADGSGTASITLNQGLGTVCFDLTWQNVDGTVFAGHIHVAPAGSPGPIVVPLFSGSFASTDAVSGCVENVDPDLIKAIRHDPAAYYVNIHSGPDFPGGALRGQLGK